MQIVLKVHHGANRPKISYIIDSGHKERGCYARNMNYAKFEKKMLEIIDVHQKKGESPSLFLHTCCAPCSTTVITRLSRFF